MARTDSGLATSLSALEDGQREGLEALAVERAELEEAVRQVRAKEAELELGWEDLQHRRRQLSQRANEVERLHAELEGEMQAMMPPGGVAPGDIIGLNFGGEEVVRVQRSLLLHFEETMLSRMFSGRHDETIHRDENGNVFFDHSPDIMTPILDFLRARRDTPPDERGRLLAPEVRLRDRAAWTSLIHLLGLEDVLDPSPHHGLDPSLATFLHGIQTGTRWRELHGWTLFFCKPYSHVTTMADFVPPEGLRGGSLLVGAREGGSDQLALAAMGREEVVAGDRGDGAVTRCHNGVQWFLQAGWSFGFAPIGDADGPDGACPLRLSWHLTGAGGWRAGSVKDLGASTAWEKVIFACPYKVPDA